MPKEVIAVGNIEANIRTTRFVQGGVVWFEVEDLAPRTAEEGWGYLDGEVLE